MCLTKAIKKFITWKDPLSIFIRTSGPSLFVFEDKGKSVLCHHLLRLKATWWWQCSCGELGLILGDWHLSGVLWYGELSNLLRDSSPFSLTLFIFSTPPFFPPSPLSPVLKIHMAPTVYSEYTTPLLLLSSSSLLILPSTFSPHPLPAPPCISEFPLIRILRVNPPNSSFHSGLAFSPSAKRTIGWEGQNKRPPCWGCAVLDPGACLLSFSLSLSFLSPLWLRQTVTHPFCFSYLLCYSFLSIVYVFSQPWALISRYQICHPSTYAPLTTYGFVFP